MTEDTDGLEGAKLFDQTALLRRRLAAAEERAADAESVARSTRAKLAKAVLEAARAHDTADLSHGHPNPEEQAAMQTLMSELADAKVALSRIENGDVAERDELENELRTAHTREIAELSQEHRTAMAAQQKQSENRLAVAVENELLKARAAWNKEHETALATLEQRNKTRFTDQLNNELRKARDEWEAKQAEQIRDVEDRAVDMMRRREREWQNERELIMQEVSEQLRSRAAPQKAAKSRTPEKKSTKRSSASLAARAFLWAAFLVAFLTLGNEFFPNAKPAIQEFANPWIKVAVGSLPLTKTADDAAPTVTAPTVQANNTRQPTTGAASNQEAALQQRISEAKAAIEATTRRERDKLARDLSKIRADLQAAEARATGAETSLADAKTTHAKEAARLRADLSARDKRWRSTIDDLQQQVRTLRAQLTAGKSARSNASESSNIEPGVRSAE